MSQKNLRVAENPEMSISEINLAYCGEEYDHTLTEAEREINLNLFLHALSEKSARMDNKTLTRNGALTYLSSGSALVDFNARATEFRNADSEDIARAAGWAYAEDPLLAVKLFFQTGDIRFGKGERHIFHACTDYLAANHPMVALELLPLIPEYTRWDYLIRLALSENTDVSKEATRLVAEQFHKDLETVRSLKEGETARISLLAKWMPSLQTKKAEQKALVRHFLKALHMKERDYRHALSTLRRHLHIIEKYMSAKDLDSIDMEKMTTKQQLRCFSFFRQKMGKKRHAYIQAVLRGEAKMNASVADPVNIIHEYMNDYQLVEDREALWSLLPDRMAGNGNTLVIRDCSDSISSRMAASAYATMPEAVIAITIYCAERLSGPFRNKFITFSDRPRLLDLSRYETLLDKINYFQFYERTGCFDERADCFRTNIEAAFDLILDYAVTEKLRQEDLPSYLLILSDMEFDAARGVSCRSVYESVLSRRTLFETIRAKWNEAGYQVPTLVFWNLNGYRTTFPEIDSENGVIYLSGFSTNELSMVMAGEYEKLCETAEEEIVIDEETGNAVTVRKTVQKKVILSPKEQLIAKLSKDRYAAVEEAARRGIAREQRQSAAS